MYYNISILCPQAQAVLAEIDKFVDHIASKRTQQRVVLHPRPSKKRWLHRRSALLRLTTRVTPIVKSLTAASSLLRDLSSDQKLHQLDSLVKNLTIQNVSLIHPGSKTRSGTEDSIPLDKKLESSIRYAIGLGKKGGGEGVSYSQPNSGSSRRSSIDSFHSAISSSSESASSIVSITGTMGADACTPFCPCQCHISTQVRTPSWIRSIFGTMTIHGNGSILLNRLPCNKSCGRSGAAALQVSYFAPAWILLKSLNIYIKAQSVHDFQFAVHTPRIIPRNAAVWSIIELGKLSEIKKMASRRELSPYDVTDSGRSLLNVRTFTTNSPFSYKQANHS